MSHTYIDEAGTQWPNEPEETNMKTSAQIKAFRKWWKSKEKAGYQYGPGPLATVAFGFEGGWEARQTEVDALREKLERVQQIAEDKTRASQAQKSGAGK